MSLIDSLINDGWLKTPEVIRSFKKIKREDFLPARIPTWLGSVAGELDEIKNLAELNEALPIGLGQTISQPLTVAFMLEKLEPKEGDKILDIGSGSGWTSALLAEIVGPKGMVVAIEILKDLVEFGENNVSKYNFVEKGTVKFVYGDGCRGYKKEAPYNKILCSAAACKRIPLEWKKQLKIGGRIVAPIDSSIWLFIKKSEDEFEEIEFPGFAFVPLVEK